MEFQENNVVCSPPFEGGKEWYEQSAGRCENLWLVPVVRKE